MIAVNIVMQCVGLGPVSAALFPVCLGKQWGDVPMVWVCVTQMGDPDGILAFWLPRGPAPAVAASPGVDQHSLILCNFFFFSATLKSKPSQGRCSEKPAFPLGLSSLSASSGRSTLPCHALLSLPFSALVRAREEGTVS